MFNNLTEIDAKNILKLTIADLLFFKIIILLFQTIRNYLIIVILIILWSIIRLIIDLKLRHMYENIK